MHGHNVMPHRAGRWVKIPRRSTFPSCRRSSPIAARFNGSITQPHDRQLARRFNIRIAATMIAGSEHEEDEDRHMNDEFFHLTTLLRERNWNDFREEQAVCQVGKCVFSCQIGLIGFIVAAIGKH